jgi:nitrite reductase/ring-hydroxylating ferredoxin subunit
MGIEFIPVAELTEVPPGRSKVVRVAGKAIALFNVDGAIYAMENRCPHEGGPVGDGEFVGAVITCPSHQWQFDVRTGACAHDPSVLAKTYDVRVDDGLIFVEASRLLVTMRRHREILRRLAAGELPDAIGREAGLSPQAVTRAAEIARIAERLQYLAEVYSRKGRVGGADLRAVPYRSLKAIDGELLTALDALTRLL